MFHKNSGMEKIYGSERWRGRRDCQQISVESFFYLIVSINFVEVPFCIVFQKKSSSEKLYE